MPQDGINKLRSGARINEAEAKRMKKGLSKEQILKLRSGAQISATEANRFKVEASAATRRLERKGMKRRTRLGKSLTSKKRGFMSPGGTLHLGKRK